MEMRVPGDQEETERSAQEFGCRATPPMPGGEAGSGGVRGEPREAPAAQPRARAAAWVLLGAIVALGLAGCATPQASATRGDAAIESGQGPGTDAYKMGPVTVWLRPQPEVEFLCHLRLPPVDRDRRVMGCYLPDTHTIIAVADPQVLLHEFKHHFDGNFHP